MRLIDADAFDTILENGEIEAKKQRKYVLAGALNTVRGNLAKQSSVSQSNCSEIPNNWIPCSERLPKDKQECLITAKALNMFCIDLARFGTDLYSVDKYDFHDRKGKSGWYYFDSDLGFVELPDVVAWMPLPEPYREVEE